ncbi:MAG: hypothetical protein JSU69_02535, partial [Candidatus Zixiibacteriota bacterium]
MSRKFHALMGFLILTLLIIVTPALAQNKPVQLALFTPVQIFPETDPIAGVRINLIYGRSVSVTGLDLGLVNHTTTGKSMGVQFGTVGFIESDFVGWQDNAVNIT